MSFGAFRRRLYPKTWSILLICLLLSLSQLLYDPLQRATGLDPEFVANFFGPFSALKLSSKSTCPAENFLHAQKFDQSNSTSRKNIRFFLPATGPDESIVTSLKKELPSPQDFQQLSQQCNATCQVEILLPKTCDNETYYWELQTFDVDGNPKTGGGDEFYVTYKDQAVQQSSIHPTAVAEISDLQNGRYRLEFIQSPMNHRHGRRVGRGYLTVTLQYTCGIGRLYPPAKKGWNSGGHMVAREWTMAHVVPAPRIQSFQPPLLLDTLEPLFRDKAIIPFGDSVMQQFVAPLDLKLPNEGKCLNTTTVQLWISSLDKQHQVRLQTENTVLLVGSGAWDLLEVHNTGGLQDHKQAMKIFVHHVRNKYPLAQIVWKSPTALHSHVPMLSILTNDKYAIQKLRNFFNLNSFMDRMRYMSASRSWDLSQAQQDVCRQWNITFLDVYQASYLSADRTRIGDGRHYAENLNTMMVHWFVKETPPEQIWRIYKSSFAKKRRLLQVSIELGDDDCLSSSYEAFWTGLVNAAIIAYVTNKRIVISVRTNTQQEVANNCIASHMIKQQYLATGKERTGGISVQDRLVLDSHSSLIKVPFTLQSLKEQGYARQGTLALRNAEKLFSMGESLLYGMVLTELLIFPDYETTQGLLLDSSKNVVWSVHPGGGLKEDQFRSCMANLIEKEARPYWNLGEPMACQVLFPNQEMAGRWNDILKSQYNCTAMAASSMKSSEPTTHPMAAYARVVAETAHDGLIVIPSPSLATSPSSSEMFVSLVRYLRFDKARKAGQLPIQDDQWPVDCSAM